MVGSKPPSIRRVLRIPAIAILVGVALIAPGELPAEVEELPAGLFVGKWILRPSVVSGLTFASNPFFQSSEQFVQTAPGDFSLEPRDIQSDRIFVVTPRIEALLPFKNSLLALDYEIAKLDFELSSENLPRDTVETIGGELSLLFGTFDRLLTGYRRTSGLARSALFDQGGEAVFDGSAFTFSEFRLGASRDVIGKRGWAVELRRQTLRFDEGTTVQFFEYDGWTFGAEYREPISPVRWLTVTLEGRDFDHYQINRPRDEPFRREESVALYVGVVGRLGLRRDYNVRLGYRRSEFPGSEGSDYKGLVGDGYLSLGIGTSLRLVLTGARLVWPSFFAGNNYYVSNQFSTVFEKRFKARIDSGLRFRVGLNQYPDGAMFAFLEEPIRREDNLWDAEVYANFRIRELIGFRVSVVRQSRDSSVPTLDYEADTLFAGVSFGWL